MYKRCIVKKGVLNKLEFINDIFLAVDKKSRMIIAYSFKSYEELWRTNNKDYTCFIINNEILSAFLRFYNLKGEVIYSKENYLEYNTELVNNHINEVLFKTIDEEKEFAKYSIFDTLKKAFKKRDLILSGRPFFITDNSLISIKRMKVNIYNKTDFSLLWQKDLGELLTYNHDGKEIVGTIYQIKQYKDSLIVVSDGGIIRLVLETGEVLWHTKGYTTSLEIVNEKAYASTNASLSKINLETGERSGYGWEYHRLPDIEWQGKNYSFFGAEGIYHQGLLWFYSFSSGESFIIAINPHDGYYEWVHHVETNEKVDSIKFHKDKMFLHDTGGTLHIYEKQ